MANCRQAPSWETASPSPIRESLPPCFSPGETVRLRLGAIKKERQDRFKGMCPPKSHSSDFLMVLPLKMLRHWLK